MHNWIPFNFLPLLRCVDIKYQRYLEQVVDYVSEDYGEIADILNRHKTLQNANEDLQLRQKSTALENEQKRAEFRLNVKVTIFVLYNHGFMSIFSGTN